MNAQSNIALLASRNSPLHPMQELLSIAGFQCNVFQAGRDLIHGLGHDSYDMLLIDRDLPDISAIDVIRAVRAVRNRDVPIVMFSGDSDDDDMVEALDAGADDYIVRPLNARVLLARIAALRRRMAGTRLNASMPLRAGPYELNNPGRFATLHGQRIPMTPKEFDLAMLMFANAGRILATQRIENTIWGHTLPHSSRALAGLVSRMRRTLDLRAENGVTITVVYAQGYRLDILDSAARAELTAHRRLGLAGNGALADY
ncbi:DNA-binding response regulator, OmpR family, contains REC and winged-helix (wHTH) domain [Ralstonia sp. 25mfcol4.1]|uniref:response regulator transcription factor n=1 Tax=Burkholderiaceae TaxID=119060 RepID=UPI000880F539|nr:response regulator transcription factor [Ralstonia sp. 25mfcol4.1]SDP51542.1 DNA-binding response regulator, OmpR family, contains REC and winged-helix (wHTH) domain [Ralstonia sp. 25mfcol4.1]